MRTILGHGFSQATHTFQRTCLGLVVCIVFTTLVWGQLDLDRMRSLAFQRYGQDTANLVDEWSETIEAMKSMPEAQKLDAAKTNKFFKPKDSLGTRPRSLGSKRLLGHSVGNHGQRQGVTVKTLPSPNIQCWC